MIGITVKADVEEVKRWMNSLQRDKVPAAASRAINKTLANVKTESSKRIRDERALSASVVKGTLTIYKANKAYLYGSLIASGRPIPLREYQARQTNKGVTVKVSPGGRKLIVQAGNHAFQVGRYGDHVYIRTGKSRLPIKKLYGPSIPATFLKQKIIDAMDRVAGDNWPKRFAEELRYELSR
jgi:hypothetical protein